METLTIPGSLWGAIFGIFIFISGSFTPGDIEYQKYLENRIDSLSCQLDERQLEIENKNFTIHKYDSIISNPLALAERLIQVKEEFYEEVAGQDWYLGTKFRTVRYLKLPSVSESMLAAMLDYDGPPALITSATRKWSKRSHHYYGNALDIRLDENGIAMAKWLITEEGKEWLNRWNIGYYIEDNQKRFIFGMFSEEHRPFFFVNPRATGPHIHIYLK